MTGGTPTERAAEAICACDGRVWHVQSKATQMKYLSRARAAIDALGLTEEQRRIECPRCNWDLLGDYPVTEVK